jgi:hypothetical protein
LHSCLKIESAKTVYDRNREAISELANLIGWRESRKSDELKEIMEKKGDCKAILSKAALCVFQVRNSLFHKGKVLPLLAACNDFLRDVISKTIVDILCR